MRLGLLHEGGLKLNVITAQAGLCPHPLGTDPPDLNQVSRTGEWWQTGPSDSPELGRQGRSEINLENSVSTSGEQGCTQEYLDHIPGRDACAQA